MLEIAKKAHAASIKLAIITTEVKNKALEAMAQALKENKDKIIQENEKDLKAAEEAGLSKALIDRLTLNEERINAMSMGLLQVADLPDPVGKLIDQRERPNGLKIDRVRVPIGVIGFIYESRPNVTADAAALCLKSGNAVILRGGKEALNSNICLAEILNEAASKAGVPENSIQIIRDTDRELVQQMLKLHEYIDLIIPRGGKGLIKAVTENAMMPVLKHFEGICHTYVDKDADIEQAIKICLNAKVQRPGVCNAMETLLVHEAIAGEFWPQMNEEYQKAGVEIRGCEKTKEILPDIELCTEEDYKTEYLDLILSTKIVQDMDEALKHIEKYGSKHSDCIVSNSAEVVEKFLKSVDTAAAFANCSTRFHDGGEFGLGCEMGISTDKFHARGPVGLEELTSYKWVVKGTGQVRE